TRGSVQGGDAGSHRWRRRHGLRRPVSTAAAHRERRRPPDARGGLHVLCLGRPERGGRGDPTVRRAHGPRRGVPAVTGRPPARRMHQTDTSESSEAEPMHARDWYTLASGSNPRPRTRSRAGISYLLTAVVAAAGCGGGGGGAGAGAA